MDSISSEYRTTSSYYLLFSYNIEADDQRLYKYLEHLYIWHDVEAREVGTDNTRLHQIHSHS